MAAESTFVEEVTLATSNGRTFQNHGEDGGGPDDAKHLNGDEEL